MIFRERVESELFAKRTFFWAGVYGIAVLLPLVFMEEWTGQHFPPATNHPEQYFGFLGVALAWQLAFLMIARDPIRYRPLMLAAIAEKMLSSGAAVWLFATGRVSGQTLAPFVVDMAIGGLFVVSYVLSAAPDDAPGRKP